MQRLRVIYVTGLGDKGRNLAWQKRAISLWRYWGVETELFQMSWSDSLPWPSKLKRIIKRIDELSAQGHQVALVGVSAGASAVINAYDARKDKVAGVVCIAGKVNHPERIARYHHRYNPALIPSVESSHKAVNNFNQAELDRVMSRYALLDGLVRRPDSFIPGANNRVVPAITHVFVIAEQLIFGAPHFLRFLKKQAKIK